MHENDSIFLRFRYRMVQLSLQGEVILNHRHCKWTMFSTTMRRDIGGGAKTAGQRMKQLSHSTDSNRSDVNDLGTV